MTTKKRQQAACKMLPSLVKHMLTQEFGGRGTWGGNQTEAIYIITSLSPELKEKFVEDYVKLFRERLKRLLNRKNMGLKKKSFEKWLDDFSHFNPSFSGGYHFPEGWLE